MSIKDFVNPFSKGDSEFIPYIYGNNNLDLCDNKIKVIKQLDSTTYWGPAIQK